MLNTLWLNLERMSVKRFFYIGDGEIKQLLDTMNDPQKGSSANTLESFMAKNLYRSMN